MAQGEAADDGVVQPLSAVGALAHVVAVPPEVERGHLDAELADEFAQLPVVQVGARGQAQERDVASGDVVPVGEQGLGDQVEQDETGQVALAVRQRAGSR